MRLVFRLSVRFLCFHLALRDTPGGFHVLRFHPGNRRASNHFLVGLEAQGPQLADQALLFRVQLYPDQIHSHRFAPIRTVFKKILKRFFYGSILPFMAGRSQGKKGITVRFEDEEMARLEELAHRYQVSSATILRWALRALAEYVRIKGGKLVLPLDFSELDHPEAGYAEASRRVRSEQRRAIKVAEKR
jgi:hypothetical protein